MFIKWEFLNLVLIQYLIGYHFQSENVSIKFKINFYYTDNQNKYLKSIVEMKKDRENEKNPSSGCLVIWNLIFVVVSVLFAFYPAYYVFSKLVIPMMVTKEALKKQWPHIKNMDFDEAFDLVVKSLGRFGFWMLFVAVGVVLFVVISGVTYLIISTLVKKKESFLLYLYDKNHVNRIQIK